MVALEGIYVRKNEKNNEGNRFASVQPRDRFSGTLDVDFEDGESPYAGKILNLSAIPSAIKVEGILKSANDNAFAPPLKKKQNQFNSRRLTEGSQLKAKKVEDTAVIIDRVVRANCCLLPQNPESTRIMAKAVGNFDEYVKNPTKAMRIRVKFMQNNFLQGVTEDFMSVQNLERNVERVLIQSADLFRHYEIFDEEE